MSPGHAADTITAMDTSQFDEKIDAADERLKVLRKEMATARDAFVGAVTEHASNWFEHQVRTAIERDPDRAKALGLDGLGALKSGLADLRDRVGEIVRTEFTRKIHWPHDRDELPRELADQYSNPYTTYGHRVPDVYDEPLRHVLGAVQPLIAEHSLNPDTSHRELRSAGDRYPYALSWPPDLQEPAKVYAALYSQFRETWQAKWDAETAKAKAEAKDLWNRA